MNKSGFIKELVKQTNLSENECIIINDILEDYPILGKKNKEHITKELEEKLKFSQEEAEEIFNTVANIITTQIKEKIIHPFRSKD